MVQVKPKRGKSIEKFLARLRSPRIYIPWLASSLHPRRLTAAELAHKKMIREMEQARKERQGPRLEPLEPRIYLSGVSWITPGGGDWSTGSNWSTGTVPGVGDTAIIASLNPGAQVTHSTGSSTVAAVQASSPVEVTGGDLTVTGSTQINDTTLTLAGGTLTGTTISIENGGTVQTEAGTTSTLDATTLDGNLTVTPGSTLDIADSLTLGNSATITVDAGGTLNFVDGTSNTQTVSGTGSIILDAASGSYAAGQINADGANSGSQVTFDNGVGIAGSGDGSSESGVMADAGNTIILDNTVTNVALSAASGGYLQVGGTSANPTVFNAVTLNGNLTLNTDSVLSIENGLTEASGATITQNTGSQIDMQAGSTGTQSALQSWTGDGTVTAQISGFNGSNTQLAGGVAFLDSTSSGAAMASVTASNGGSLTFQWISSDGGTAQSTTVSGINAPVWVQLVRSGSLVSAWYSTDGSNWIQIGTGQNITFSNATILAGMAMTDAGGVSTDDVMIGAQSVSSTNPNRLTDQDIGSPGIAGSATYDSSTGVWTVIGGGANIWDASDQFNFASENLTGDGSIVAEVTSQTDTNTRAMAGVMIRNDNTAGSAFVDVMVTPGDGLAFQVRSTAGGSVSEAQVVDITSPVWVELVRSGDNFSAYYSTDDTTWIQIGSTQTLQINPTALAGLAVTAHDNTKISTADFSNVAVTAAPALPSGFTDQDIGNPQYIGSAAYDTATGDWTVIGGGANIWDASDQFNFASENLTGDGSIVAEVDSQTDTNTRAMAGVMIRNDNTAGSAFVDVMVTPGDGLAFQVRSTAGGSVSEAQVADITAPVWVELVRSGDNFSAYYSTDGTTWTQIGNTQAVQLNTTALAGLAVTAHTNNALSTATFSNVAVTAAPALPDSWTDQDIGSPQYAGTASYDAGVWTLLGGGTDIWSTPQEFNFAAQSFTGDGQIIAEVTSQTDTNADAKAGVMFRNDNTDGSAFADVVATPGDGVSFQWWVDTNSTPQSVSVTGITAPVWVKLTRVGNSFSAYYSTDGNTWIQIGTAQTIQMGTTALAGLAVTAHDNGALGTATFSNVSLGQGTAPSSAVTDVTATASASGQINLSWTDPNAVDTDYLIERSTTDDDFQLVSMVLAGTTSYSDDALQSDTTYYYQVIAENAGGLAPASATASTTTGAATLTAPWNSTDVGSVAVTGSASYSDGAFTVTGAGNVANNIGPYYYIGNTSDTFQYAYQSLGSNGQIVAEINSQTDTGNYAQAGLMLRAAGGDDAVFGGIFITPGEGVEFLTRNAQGVDAVMQADISYAPPSAGSPVWLKLTTQDGVITGYISTDGANWSQIGQAEVNVGSAATAGLAVGSASNTATGTAVFSNVAIGAVTSASVAPETAQSIHTEVYSGSDGRITWRPMTDVTSITVEQSTDGGDTWTTVGVIPGTADTWLPTGLTPNTTYDYRIQAGNADGSSPWSPVVSLTTASNTSYGLYQVPIDVAGTVTNSNITVDVTTSQAYVYADSWQQAFFIGAGGQETNNNLDLTYPVGNFAMASTGDGYYGNSYGINISNVSSDPSYSMGANMIGLNDTALMYYYNGYQNDQSDAGNQTDNCTPTSTQTGTQSCSCPPPAGKTPAASSDPVQYYNGSPEITSPGLTSLGFDGEVGVNLNWTTMTVYTPDSVYGNGWSNDNSNGSYLTNIGGTDAQNPDVLVVNNAYNQDEFDYNSATGLYQVSAMATSTLTHDTATGTYTMITDAGNSFEYYDFSSTTPANLQGKLIATTDSAGNQANWTYNSSGQLIAVTQTDAAGDVETFAYTYMTSGINAGKVSLITQSLQYAGESSSTLYRQMALTYYDGSYTGDMQYGNAGDLQSVTLEDAGGNVIDQSVYRYYTPSEIADGAQGFAGGLQYVFNYSAITSANEALAAYNAANSTSYDLYDAPASIVASYADNYFQYNANHQVTLETASGAGGTATEGQGTITYAYYQNPNFVAGDSYNTWFTRTTQTNPDGSEEIVYTNINGDELLQMMVDNSGSDAPTSLTAYTFDSDGRQLETINSSAINLDASILNGAASATTIEAALEQYSDLGISEGLVYGNQGLIDTTTYYSTTTAGGVEGMVEADYVRDGADGTPIEQDSYTYIEHQDYAGNIVFPVAGYTEYQSAADGGSTPEITTYNYTWQENTSGQVTNQIEDETVTNPVVATSQNGSGTATTTQTVYNVYGQAVWTMDASGAITYTAYDNTTGAVIQTVQDVNTSDLSDLTNYSGTYAGGTLTFTDGYNQMGVPELPSGWATPAGDGLNLTTTDYVDDQGRTIEQISPDGNITLYVYDDADHAMFTLTGVILDTENDTLTTTDPITMTRNDIAYNYTSGGSNYSGTYTETMTFSANTPISYLLGGNNGETVIPVLPGFIQGDSAASGPNNVLNLIGDGTASAPQFTIQSLTRTLNNIAGQMVEVDTYAVIDNATYLATAQGSPYSGSQITNQLSGDAPNGNYYATYYGYDADGNQYQVIDANGTITDSVYNTLGQVVAVWVGTNDTTGSGKAFNGSNAGTGNNMKETTSYVYDGGGVGDGNVTEVIQYPDGNTAGTQQVSVMSYNFRDQLIATETGLTLNISGDAVTSSSDAYPMITVYSLDNLGDVTATSTINGGAITLDDAITAAATVDPGEVVAGLIGYSTSEYDSENRDYEDMTYSVDPTTGTVSDTALTTYTFYGPRGNVIETVAPTGEVTKYVYNGVDELVDTYTTDGGAVNNNGSTVLTYTEAGSVANDVVIEQTAYGYDGDGNLIETVDAQRFNTDQIFGGGTQGALFTDTVNSDGSLTVHPTGDADNSLDARIYYSANYYDAADREIATANAGTNPVGAGGAATPWTRPDTAPTSVTDSNFTGDLITLTSYNAAGEVYEATDALGNVSAYFYNNEGEVTISIAAYDPSVNDGNPTDDQNQTTLYTYDGIGDETSMTAEDPSTGNQTTTYIYGVNQNTGSTLADNDLLYQTVYPSLTSQPAANVTNSYNATGDVTESTDQNGNVHQYTYDTAGREISDTVTTLGAGVDGSVRRIDTAYNAQGLAYLFTSYADTAGTTIANQVEDLYNGLGQLAIEYQAVTGAVSFSATPMIQYMYSDPSNGSLLTSMVYPNGRAINYNYGDTDSVQMSNNNAMLDNAIGRLDAIVDGANSGDSGTILEQYSYLGLSTIVAENQPFVSLSLRGETNSIGSGGDQYVGLDQFGRVVDQNWESVQSAQSVDDITYSYDAGSNVTAENNLLDSAYSQTFTYDPLNRLASSTLGGVADQSWTLDSQGNWSSFTSGGTTQTETTNAQNQITSISGSTTPTYDAAGNMISGSLTGQPAGSADTLVYNAWNQLMSVSNASGQVMAQYTYNAKGYRISETYPQGGNGVAAGTTNYIYYDSNWQAIETRTNGTADSNVASQMVWSASYVNAAVLQDTYSSGTIQSNSRLYFEYDANYNTTAVVGYDSNTGTWDVTQRYTYSPYGTITILNADWSTPSSGTQPNVNNLYQGMTLDPVTGLYYERNRNYSPSLGTWTSQDPAGYINGANRYQFVMSNPVNRSDPLGLALSDPTSVSWGTPKISGKCPLITVTWIGTEDLGDIYVPFGENANHSTLNSILKLVLEGLDKFSGLGAALTALVQDATGNGGIAEEWHGTVTLKRTKIYKCCNGKIDYTPISVSTVTTHGPTWNPLGSASLTAGPDWIEEDKQWIDIMEHILDETK